MAFTGYNIFPGLQTIGVVSAPVQELATTFNLSAINALQKLPDESLAWADVAGVTAAEFRGKIPLDFTALDGFEPYKGTRSFKQIDVAAVQADVEQWQRNLEWDLRLSANAQLDTVYGLSNKAQAMVDHARRMKARLAATVFMKGTPTVNLAQVYAGNSIPGASKSLFNTAHLANPLDAGSKTFSNYHAAAGQFNSTQFAQTRLDMRSIPSPNSSVETLGIQVTDIIGGSRMEEAFRQVAMQQLSLQTSANTGATGLVAGATTNIYVQGTTNWRFWIAPQLDGDAYYTANAGKHMWIAISRQLPGANSIEMVAPSVEFMPKLQLFGDGTEMAAMTRKVHLIGDLDAGAAAGLPHVVARYEET